MTANTAELTANVLTELAAMPDRQATSATFTARELDTRRWMLTGVEVTYSATTVTVHFRRGDARTADQLATALLDKASEHLPLDAGGVIVADGPHTYSLKF